MEYITIFGVNFVQTVDAPLNHVKIHPLVVGDMLRAISDQVNNVVDIYVHKGELPEITLEDKITQLKKG